MNESSLSIIEKVIISACFVVPIGVFIYLYLEPAYLKWAERRLDIKRRLDSLEEQLHNFTVIQANLRFRLCRLEEPRKSKEAKKTNSARRGKVAGKRKPR